MDVVLSEIDIAGSMNGVGFAQWARSVRPELQILLAGTPEHTVRNAAELCEAGPMLRKPYEHKLVLDRIKRLLWLARSSGAGVDPSIGRIWLEDPRCLRGNAPMNDTPRPPPLPQRALIWIVVAALVLVLVRAGWRGLL